MDYDEYVVRRMATAGIRKDGCNVESLIVKSLFPAREKERS